ncbi:MAG: CGGC domain-containing protein [Halanaerobacter sp.]
MKIAIIRCLKAEEECIAQPCLNLIKARKNKFAEIEEIELVGLITCGGCPGKKISLRTQSLLEDGADKVVLTSCITKGTCRGEVCPHLDAIKESVLNVVDEDKVIFSTL